MLIMSQCSRCGNEKFLCVCTKGIGGEASPDYDKYNVEQMAAISRASMSESVSMSIILNQVSKLEELTKQAHIPAIGYAYVEPGKKNKNELISSSITVGKKNAELTNTVENEANEKTQFPASSLSKIVFTYLVLQWVKENQINLNEPLHELLKKKEIEWSKPLNHVWKYERFMQKGEYPEFAKQVTLRHILSHTSGLPNVGDNPYSTLAFNSKPGEKYSYSGEAFLYLQKVIEATTGKNLEDLAIQYVFKPLGMKNSTFVPKDENSPNVVKVHTELGKAKNIYIGDPPVHAAGSLLTTAQDFSKFISAWVQNMEDPIIQDAFKPANASDFPTCGLGWHLYKNKEGELIAYQYGENPNTRSFIAINVTTRKGAVIFTNSINGSSILEQLLNSSDFTLVGTMHEVFKHLHYAQSNEPGWKEIIAGKIAEDQNNIEEARHCFVKASNKAFEDKSRKQRLEWFDRVHQTDPRKPYFQPLETFVGTYTNKYGSRIEVSSTDGDLVYTEWGQKIKLVRISENEFLPEKDQTFKLILQEGRMKINLVQGGPDMFLSKDIAPKKTGIQKLFSEWKARITAHREEFKNQLQNDGNPGLNTPK